MRDQKLLILLLALGFLVASLALAQPEMRYDMRLDIDTDDLRLVSAARVVVRLESRDLQVGQCLYVPLHDPMVERIAALQAIGGRNVQDMAARQTGRLVWMRPELLQPLRPFVYQIRSLDPDRSLTLAYSLELPGWKDREVDIRLVTQFYPQLLRRCPQENEEPYFFAPRSASFRVDVDHPQEWSILAPGQQVEGRWVYQGPGLSLVFFRQGQVHEIQDSRGRLRLLYRSPAFLDLAAQLHRASLLFEDLMGWRPSNDLLLVEMDDYEPLKAPGLITLNRPRQPLMRYLQENLLNWDVWQMAHAVAEQWFGLTLRPQRLEDYWLVQGFADHLTLLFAESEYTLRNLFVGTDGEEAYLQLHYRQAQDLSAALVSQIYPRNALVDEALRSRRMERLRAPLSFIRHAQALRYIHWLLKDPGFGRWLQQVGQRFQTQGMTPQELLTTLEGVEPKRAQQDLLNYWQADSWPDFALAEVRPDQNGQGSQVSFRQDSVLSLRFDVSVKTREGYRFHQDLPDEQGRMEMTIPVPPDSIEHIEINPQQTIYDQDRFNNTNRWSRIALFPGNARTLANDAYTMFWMPFATKLPGKDLSLLLGWQMFRYVGSSLSGFALYEPEENEGGYRILYQHGFTDHALFLLLSLGENDGKALAGERLWDLNLIKRSFWSAYPTLTMSSRLRFRQILGRSDEDHVTTALRVVSRAERFDPCGWDAEAESEFTSYVPSDVFRYHRYFGVLRFGCEIPQIQARARTFAGVSQRSGLVPAGALFAPQNLDEARIRIDRPALTPTGSLRSINLDLSVPARLPLPESAFILPRRSQFRVFYDAGFVDDAAKDLQVSGAGLVLPLGGDVMGKSSLTVLQFSFFGVFYRRIGSEVSHDPGLLFDFSGDL